MIKKNKRILLMLMSLLLFILIGCSQPKETELVDMKGRSTYVESLTKEEAIEDV